MRIILLLWAWTGRAEAQSAPTCSFDAATATLTITVDGQAANVTRPGGQIRLNGVDCTGATTSTTDMIVVNGGARDDVVTINGAYEPGLTAEDGGSSEIEILFHLGSGDDDVRIKLADFGVALFFTAHGIDIGHDGDRDITTAGVEKVRVYTSSVDDIVHAEPYVGGGTLYLYGGAGNDALYGSAQGDWLYGEAGEDFVYGGDGNDTLWQEATTDGADDLFGGSGIDTVNYSRRANGVFVEINNGEDDGEPGELDDVEYDVENITGGAGPDVLVGDANVNVIKGSGGDDELYGGGGRDVIHGDAGNDSLDGGDRGDSLHGGSGDDTLTGGDGTDRFFGDDGNDLLFNDDGVAETVDCGDGTGDDPEPDPLDTFVGCELI